MSHGYVRTKDLRDGVVTAAKLGTDAVTTAKIDDGAVTAAKLDSNQARTLAFKYSFAVQGGAQAALTLTSASGAAQTIPANAVIKNAYIEVETALTSGGLATVKLGFTGNDNAFLAALAFDDASLALDKFTAINAELPIKVGGSAVSVLLTPATANLTAGVVYVYVEYVPGH
jgi:hypothetical protein